MSEDQIIAAIWQINVNHSAKINGKQVRRISSWLYRLNGEKTYCTLDGLVGAVKA